MTVASRPARPRPTRARTVVASRTAAKGKDWHTVTFGDVTITAPRPSEEEMQRNVEASTAALQRVLPAFLRPGVRIYPKKDVPLFWADEENPQEGVIRKLNGKIERGVIDEDGNFKVID